MKWDVDRRRPKGGGWRCRIKYQKAQNTYEHSGKGRARRIREQQGEWAHQLEELRYQSTQ